MSTISYKYKLSHGNIPEKQNTTISRVLEQNLRYLKTTDFIARKEWKIKKEESRKNTESSLRIAPSRERRQADFSYTTKSR